MTYAYNTPPYAFNEDRTKYSLDQLLTDGILDVSSLLGSVGSAVIEMLYPVGSLYLTTDDDLTPESDNWFLPGNWEKIQDKVLIGTGSTFESEAGQAGGNADGKVTLTTSQIPLVNHTHGPGNLRLYHIHHQHNDTIVAPFHISKGSTYNGKTVTADFTQTHIQGKAIESFLAHTSGTRAIYNYNRRYGNGTGATARHDCWTGGAVNKDNWDDQTNLGAEYTKFGSYGTGKTSAGTRGDNVSSISSVDIMPPYMSVNIWQRVEDTR